MSSAATPVYFDHNATTAPAPEVVTAMVAALEQHWANPSSMHGPGLQARRMLASCRARAAAFLGCQAAELVFTSGATEANHMAIEGALAMSRGTRRQRLLVSAVEHPALLALAARLAGQGVAVQRIAVDARGRLDLDHARALITDDVALVSVMGANNETGVLMPVAEVAALAHGAGALMHVDATQLIGKTPFRFADSGADLASVSAHKFAGPKGIGALLVKKGLALPALFAGRQERRRRGGTENLPGIAGFAAACERAARTFEADLAHMESLRRRLEAGLVSGLPALHVYGSGGARLPNTLCARFGELDAEQVLSLLERAGIAASSGAACSAGGTEPSHVLMAMGEPAVNARAGVRFSLGPASTAAEVDRCIAATVRALSPLLAGAEALAA